MRNWRQALCIVVAGAFTSACTPQAASIAPTAGIPRNVEASSKLVGLPMANGMIVGINDRPYNPNSPNFEQRRAAAHAKHRFLTDELNNPLPPLAPKSSSSRRTSSLPPACDTCDPGGGSGGGSSAIPMYSIPDSPYYDEQINYDDGTSDLMQQGGWDEGNDGFIFLNPDGTVVSYTSKDNPPYCSESCGKAQPPSPSQPGTCYSYTSDGYAVSYPCGYKPFQPPAWMCPALIGGAAILARVISLRTGKGDPAIVSVGAGAGVGVLCSAAQ